jgi:hypothetical protein
MTLSTSSAAQDILLLLLLSARQEQPAAHLLRPRHTLFACVHRDEALRAFKLGILSLGERAEVDLLFEATCGKVLTHPVLLTLQSVQACCALITQSCIRSHHKLSNQPAPCVMLTAPADRGSQCACGCRSTMWRRARALCCQRRCVPAGCRSAPHTPSTSQVPS